MLEQMTKNKSVQSKSVYEPGGPSARSDCLNPVPARAHAQPRVGLDVYRAEESLGQFGGHVLCFDGYLAGDVERDGVRAVLVDGCPQPATSLGNGVVDGRRHRFVATAGAQQPEV